MPGEKCVIDVFFVFQLADLFGQQIEDVGIFGGVSAYSGDISAGKYPSKQEQNAVIGVSLHYGVSNHFVIRGEMNYTVVSGSDSFSKDSVKIKRNLSFETSILELNFLGELYLSDRWEKRLQSYLLAGLGIFHFNSYTTADGNKIFLRPQSTEGEGLAAYPDRKMYSLYQPSLVYGAGVKWVLSDRIGISCEISLRKLFTDYLDDVSKTYIDKSKLLTAKGQLAVGLAYRGDEIRGGDFNYPQAGTARGNDKNMDAYYFCGLRLIYNISPVTNYNPPGGYHHRKKQYRCPVVY